MKYIVLDKKNADKATVDCSEVERIEPMELKTGEYVLPVQLENIVKTHDVSIKYVIKDVKESDFYQLEDFLK